MSGPRYWQNIELLFDTFRKTGAVMLTDEIKWATNGLLIGANKEMRQSAVIAHEVSYRILVDTILENKNKDFRIREWDSHFTPILDQFMTSDDTKKLSETQMGTALALALIRISNTEFEDFLMIWNKLSRRLIDSIRQPISESPEEFKTLSHRWIDVALPMLRQFKGRTSEETILFLESIARPFDETICRISRFNGDWVEGMDFLVALCEDPTFGQFLQDGDQLKVMRELFKKFMSRERTVDLLRSQSCAPFIRLLLVFCRLYSQYSSELWETAVEEAIPESGQIDLLNPNSLLTQIVSIVKPSHSYLKAPAEVNSNLVRELTTILKSLEQLQPQEAAYLEDLIVSVVSLRGNSCCCLSLTILGILISNESALTLLRSMNLDSKIFISVVTKICSKDPAFAGFLIRPSSSDLGNNENENAKAWSIPALLRRVYNHHYHYECILLSSAS